jgi:hypothetical protein
MAALSAGDLMGEISLGNLFAGAGHNSYSYKDVREMAALVNLFWSALALVFFLPVAVLDCIAFCCDYKKVKL